MKAQTKILFIIFAALPLFAQTEKIDLLQEYTLAGDRAQEIQYFIMKTDFIYNALDGKRTGIDSYKLFLMCVPAGLAGKEGDVYTCKKLTAKWNDPAGGTEQPIPALKDWEYIYKKTDTRMDEKGQVLGIDHAKFTNLTDADGQPVPQDKTYHIYNNFIDFHGFVDIYAESMGPVNGIEDLKKTGDRIVHAAAFTEAPVNVGSAVAEGSFFKNGEVTMEFKGLSVVNAKTCALVGHDSGASSFHMIVPINQEQKIETVGSSHYFGDIYLDLVSFWPQKVTLIEFIVSEVTLPFPPDKVNSVVERQLEIRNVTEEEFNAEM